MSINRRTILKAGAVGIAFGMPSVRARAQAAFNIKVATNVQPTHSIAVRLTEAAEAIGKETDGRVNVRIFPSGQLGSDTDMLSQVRSGGIEYLTAPGLVLANLVPMASLNSVGFAFKDYPSVWRAMDGPMGEFIRGHITKAGLLVTDRVLDNGFRHITSHRQISEPGQLVGMKIRVPVSPLLLSLFKSLGAAPTPINFNELYSALQTKIVEGQENPVTLIWNSKLYEVQKFCAMTGHTWDGYWIVGNRQAAESMPPELRATVSKHFNLAAVAQRADSEKLAVSLQTDLAERGMVLNKPDPAPFREALRAAKFYEEWKGKLGDEAWSQLEGAVGKLG